MATDVSMTSVEDVARGRTLTQPERSWRRDPAIWLIAVATATALGLALHRLGALSLWFDEAITEVVTGWGWRRMLSHAANREANSLLYYTGLKAWGLVFGRSEEALRIPSAIAFAATVPATAAIAWRGAGRRAAVLAAVLLAVHAYLLRFGQEMRPYGPTVFFVTLAALLLLRARDRPSIGRWSAWVLVATFACYAHLFGAVAVAAQVVAVLTFERRRRELLVASGAVVAATLPLLVLLYRDDTDRLAWIPSPGRDEIASALQATTGGSRPVLALLYGAAALIGIASGWLRPPFRSLLVSWYAGPVLFALVVSIYQPLVHDKYLVVCAPALVIAAATGLARLRPAALGACALALLVVLSSFEIADWYSGDGKEDWRGVAAVVSANDQDGDLVVVVDGPLAFERYFVDRPTARAQVAGPYPPVERVAGAKRVWIVLRGESSEADALRELATAGGQEKARRWDLNHLEVELYAR